ncbi:hypothetical protein, partial [Noviherbaspirillum sp.]|uniref:hypothetical protein n=1 Tax=Noviherbaspirillum sp. TaxID=1926288 RepID=UPI002FE2B7B9
MKPARALDQTTSNRIFPIVFKGLRASCVTMACAGTVPAVYASSATEAALTTQTNLRSITMKALTIKDLSLSIELDGKSMSA